MSMILTALALAGTMFAAPQQQNPFAGAAPLPEEQVALPDIRAAMTASDRHQTVASLDRALANLPQPTRFRGVVQCMRGITLNQLGRMAEGYAAIDECYRLDPDLPFAQLIYGRRLDDTGDTEGAARLFTKALEGAPTAMGHLPVDVAETLLRKLRYAQNSAARQQFIVALVNAGYGREDPAFFSKIARETMASRIAADDVVGARALLPAVTDPRDGVMMLVDRAYQPLWPDLEAWAGGTLAVQRDATVRQARAAYGLLSDLSHRNDLAGILDRTGHADEAAALLEPVIADRALWDEERFYATTAAITLTSLRGEAGVTDPDRVVAPLRTLLASGSPDEVSGLWNAVPNLAIDLVSLGQPDAALSVLDKHVPQTGALEAEASYGYFQAIRGCALAKLGENAKARALLDDVTRRFANNRDAVNIATFCIGSTAERVALIKENLADVSQRSTTLLALARARTLGHVSGFDLVESEIGALATRPEVVALYDEAARLLPASFTPALEEWRTPL